MFAFRVATKIVLQATLPLVLASVYDFLGWTEPIPSNQTEMPAIAVSITSISGRKEAGGAMSIKQVNVQAEGGKASTPLLSNISRVKTGRTKEIWEKSESVSTDSSPL